MAIQEILKKATEVKELEIPWLDIKEVEFNELEALQGDFYKYNDNILTKIKKGWIRAKIPKNIDKLNTTKELQTTSTDEIIEWCKKLKNYFDYEISQIKKELENIKLEQKQLLQNQAETLKITKDYVDKKFNGLEKGEKTTNRED